MRRINEINYIRVFSMLAVIAIHVTSGFIHNESGFTLFGMNIAFWLNQLSRFSVPAFVLLSGLGLSLSDTDTGYFHFIKHRFIKVLAPYIIWSFVYMLYNSRFDLLVLWDNGGFFKNFITALLTGNPASHLYFTVVIFQMYLLYPIIKPVSNRYRYLVFYSSALISFYFITGIYLRGFGIEILPKIIRQEAWLMFPPWLVYFVTGLSLDRKTLDLLIISARKYLPLTALLLSVSIFCLVVESRILNTYELSIKPSLLIIVPLFCYFCLGLGGVFSKLWIINKTFAYLAKHAMNIYLCSLSETKPPAMPVRVNRLIAFALLQHQLSACVVGTVST